MFPYDDDNQDYYFAGCNEIQKPMMLTTPVILRDGTIIVAISEAPKHRMFEENDIASIKR